VGTPATARDISERTLEPMPGCTDEARTVRARGAVLGRVESVVVRIPKTRSGRLGVSKSGSRKLARRITDKGHKNAVRGNPLDSQVLKLIETIGAVETTSRGDFLS